MESSKMNSVVVNVANIWGGLDPEALGDVCQSRDLAQLSKILNQPTVESVVRALEADTSSGIDSASVEGRRTAFGSNTYERPPGATFLSLMWDQIRDPMILLLIVAATVSTILGIAIPQQREEKAYVDGIAIWGAVIVVIAVGAGNDYHKELQFRKLNAAKDILQTKVVRDGVQMVVASTKLVVGDLVLLDTGDKIAADGVLVEPYRMLCMDESSLTGESDAVHKTREAPFIISGSQVVEGEGRMVVLAVGPRTEWGRLIALISSDMDSTPLQEKLSVVAAMVAKVGFGVSVACFAVLFIFLCVEIQGFPTTGLQWTEVLDYFLYAVTIIVVAVPEGLPLAVTISLAYSMRKMMKDNNFVRHLSACETMGGATCICTDKTGTLTQNRMTVVEGWLAGSSVTGPPSAALNEGSSSPEVHALVCEGIATNSKAFLVEPSVEGMEADMVGNRTECALLLLLRSCGVAYAPLRDAADIEAVGTFSAQRKMSSVLLRLPERARTKPSGLQQPCRLHVKGAAEIVLQRCCRFLNSSGEAMAINEEKRYELQALITTMASRGLRTLAISFRDDFDKDDPSMVPITDLEKDMTLIALFGIKDPVRPAVPQTVVTCHEAGITVKMVTGDNLHTAEHIARECGLVSAQGIVLDGPTFRAMADRDIISLLPRLEVLARSTPEDKYRLVSLLRAQGEVIAVTGDGTNDAPALKEADVGLAMGIAGTDVAKEASDIIILDDNFGSIVKAVQWGRSIFGNVRKFLQFQLTVNLVALFIAFLAAVTGKGAPLNVLQLLWVNLIMDSLAALALATEAPTSDILKQKPHGRHEPLLTGFMKYHILVQSVYQIGWLMFLLYGLPNIGIHKYRPGCTVPCEEWAGGGACVVEYNPVLLEAASSVPTGCSDSVAIEAHNHHAGVIEGQAVNSLLFNTFIFMQLFNEINSRRLDWRLNTFSGILSNPIFLGVIGITLALQVVIMQTPLSTVFKVAPQTWQEWLFAVAVGAGSMLMCIAGKIAGRTCCFFHNSRASSKADDDDDDDDDGDAKGPVTNCQRDGPDDLSQDESIVQLGISIKSAVEAAGEASLKFRLTDYCEDGNVDGEGEGNDAVEEIPGKLSSTTTG